MASSSTLPLPKPTIFLLEKSHNFQEITQLHAQLVISGLINRHPNPGKLIKSYVSVNKTHNALSVFNTIKSPDLFAYNTLIRGLKPDNSLLLFNQLLFTGLKPDNYTYTFVLKACSILEGKQVHAQIIKAGIKPDTHIQTSLIHMYAKYGCMDFSERVVNEFDQENVVANNCMISGYMNLGHVEVARHVFDKISIKDTATWSAMISGYYKNGVYDEALLLFQESIFLGVELNESMLVSVLCACARSGSLAQGRWIHLYIDRIGGEMSVNVGTCIVDMYCKCGCIESGYEVFRSVAKKDVVTWGVMISGFAMHGQVEKCVQLFEEMIGNEIQPNGIVFVAILSACSHAGYVKLGEYYFNQMVQFYGIRPSIEHYGCMVDLLGRAGRLGEAEEIILSMSQEPNAVIWGTLLAGCRMHKDLKRGERVFKELIKLEPMSGDRYKLGGNLFADVGEREEVRKIRKLVKDENLEMTYGSSFVEVDGVVHRFVVGDVDHIESREIYGMLEGIN